MKTILTSAAVSIPAAFALQAGEIQRTDPIETPTARSSWQIGIGPSAIFGAKADFSDLGRWRSPLAAPPTAGTVDREYDDGFNRVDATGNAGILTSYWGYQSDSQYHPAGAGSIAMSIYNGRSNGSASDEATGWGGEIFAAKEMGPVAISGLAGATWGWRFALNVNKFNFEDHSTVETRLNVLTDSYDLGGAGAPGTPFSGSPLGFGNALLGDQPTRSFGTMTAATRGSRDLDAVLFGFSAGPYLDIPVLPQFTARIDAGVTLALLHGSYDYSSTTTIAGLAPQRSGGSEVNTDLLPGFYVGLSGIYAVTPQVSIIGSVRYQYLDNFEVNAGDSHAEIDFSGACMVSLGAIYQF